MANRQLTNMGRDDFEDAVSEALDRMPERFADLIENLVVQVEEQPADDVMLDLDLDPHHDTLFGLYTGVPLDQRGGWYGNVLPDLILLFRQPLLGACRNRTELVRQIQLTLLHEVGHHFGLDDEEMDTWETEFSGLY